MGAKVFQRQKPSKAFFVNYKNPPNYYRLEIYKAKNQTLFLKSTGHRHAQNDKKLRFADISVYFLCALR